MKHAMTAALSMALALGLAAAAQAQGNYGSRNDMGNAPPSAANGAAMQNTAPGAEMQNTAPGAETQGNEAMPMHRTAAKASRNRAEIKQAQEQLKSQGLYHGRIDGIVGHRTREAIKDFQARNGLHRTARLDRNTLDRLMGSRTSGVGSSAPNEGMGNDNPTAGDGSANPPPPTVLRGSQSSAPNGSSAAPNANLKQ